MIVDDAPNRPIVLIISNSDCDNDKRVFIVSDIKPNAYTVPDRHINNNDDVIIAHLDGTRFLQNGDQHADIITTASPLTKKTKNDSDLRFHFNCSYDINFIF